jgi:hypothetical protein
MQITIDPTAADKIRAAIEAGTLKAGSWGDGNRTVCMMSALVSGADSTSDCVTAGWPEWLASLNISLFDAEVGAADEGAARAEFALRVAELVQTPRDYEKARDLFLIRRLDDGEHSALKSLRLDPVDADWWRNCEAAIATVVGLLRRRAAGEDVADEMKAAARAAAAARAPRRSPQAAYAAYTAAALTALSEQNAALTAQVAELMAERERLGREVNLARYGQPDFAWSVHTAAMAELQAKVARLEGALDDEAAQEVDRLRLRAFATNLEADRMAYFNACSRWFQNRHTAALTEGTRE